MSYPEQILEAKPLKKSAVWLLPFHLTNHEPLHMDVPVLADQQELFCINYADIWYSLEDLLREMDDGDGWWESQENPLWWLNLMMMISGKILEKWNSCFYSFNINWAHFLVTNKSLRK